MLVIAFPFNCNNGPHRDKKKHLGPAQFLLTSFMSFNDIEHQEISM